MREELLQPGFELATRIDFGGNVPEQEYRNDPRLNFHTLLKFQRDPKAFRDGYFSDDKVTDAMRAGTVLHTLVLEPEKFRDSVAVYERPINSSTGNHYGATTKVVIEHKQRFAEENAGKIIIDFSDYVVLKTMADKLESHELAQEILCVKQYAVEQMITGNLLGIDVKGRIDAYTAAGLIDVKTTDSLDDFSGRDKFRKAIYEYKYIVQLAFYHAILRQSYNAPYIPVWLIAFEKNPPHRIGVYSVTRDVLDSAYDTVYKWLSKWKYAIENDVFESRYNSDVQIIGKYDSDKD